ncbi:MAG: hypothetical protein CVV04_11550 [Firmicutes bacterium HGW-Firmicutes-9]|nr:MAG: hypothetical protein CVV04_11550 [Firmicutes bacterium HGW-Firmicutes-9]
MQYPYAIKRYLEPKDTNDVYHKTFHSKNLVELEDMLITHIGHLDTRVGSQSRNMHRNNKFIGITTLFGDNKNSYYTLKKNLIIQISKHKRRVKLTYVEEGNLKHPLRQLLSDRILNKSLKNTTVINENSKISVLFWSVAASISGIAELLIVMLNDKYLNAHWLLLVAILLTLSTLAFMAVSKSGKARKELLERKINTLESNGSDEEFEDFFTKVYAKISSQARRRNESNRRLEKEIVLIENLSASGNLLKRYLLFFLSCSHKKGCLENSIWICFENQEEPYISNFLQAIEQYNPRLINFYFYRQLVLSSNDIERISFELNLHNQMQRDFYKQVGIDYLLAPLYHEAIQNSDDYVWGYSSTNSGKVQRELMKKVTANVDIKALYIYSTISGCFLQSFRKQDINELFQRSRTFGLLNIPNTEYIFGKKEISKKEAEEAKAKIVSDFSDWMVEVKSDLVSIRHYCCSYILYKVVNQVINQHHTNDKCELDLWILMYLIDHPLALESYSFAWFDFATLFLSIDTSCLNELTLYTSVANAMLRLMEKSGCFIFHYSILSKITQVLVEQKKLLIFFRSEYFRDFQNHFFHLFLTNCSDSSIILHYKFIQLFATKFDRARVEPEHDVGIINFNAFFAKKKLGFVRPDFYLDLMFQQNDPCQSFYWSIQYFYSFIQDSGEGYSYVNLFHKEMHNVKILSEIETRLSYPISEYCRMIYSLMQLVYMALNPEYVKEGTENNAVIIRYRSEYAKRWNDIKKIACSAITTQLHQSSKWFRAIVVVSQHLVDVLDKRYYSMVRKLNEVVNGITSDSHVDIDKMLLDELILASSNEGIVQTCYFLIMLRAESALYYTLESDLKRPLSESVQNASIISLLKYEAFNRKTGVIDSCIIPCYYKFLLNGPFQEDVKMACIIKHLRIGAVGEELLHSYIKANENKTKVYIYRALEALLQNSQIDIDDLHSILVTAINVDDRELSRNLCDLICKVSAQTENSTLESIAIFSKAYLLNEIIEDISLEDLDGAMRILPIGAYRMGLLQAYALQNMKYAMLLPKHLDSYKMDNSTSGRIILPIYFAVSKKESTEVDASVRNAFISSLDNPMMETRVECHLLIKSIIELGDSALDDVKRMVAEKLFYLDYIEFLSTMLFSATTLPSYVLGYNEILISRLREVTNGLTFGFENDSCHLLETYLDSDTFNIEIYKLAIQICTTKTIIGFNRLDYKKAVISESMLALKYLCKFADANEEISSEDIREFVINQYNWSKQLLEMLISQESVDELRKQVYRESLETLESCLVSTCLIPTN